MQALFPVWGVSENAACECVSVLKAAASVNNNAHHTVSALSCPCRFTGRSWKTAALVEQFSYIKDNDFFFWKLDRRNKIYLLEVYKFLLVEGGCRIFAASECSLNTLHWREVYFFS